MPKWRITVALSIRLLSHFPCSLSRIFVPINLELSQIAALFWARCVVRSTVSPYFPDRLCRSFEPGGGESFGWLQRDSGFQNCPYKQTIIFLSRVWRIAKCERTIRKLLLRFRVFIHRFPGILFWIVSTLAVEKNWCINLESGRRLWCYCADDDTKPKGCDCGEHIWWLPGAREEPHRRRHRRERRDWFRGQQS